ncbi:MAG: GMC family oxidoreductase [Lewinellaceae bacterium]|nr:GMC family oxidoreductase [Saprospiraceae bacterium]MCB9338416.1 GMC family oxidoreductase [Lewinellaceae bacterium]
MSNINGKWQQDNTYDAIVIGSGISGGWAAKELSEKGLKTLVLERGRMVKHVTDYPTMNFNPWDLKYADRVPQDEIDKHYPKQNRTGYTVRQGWKHWFVKDDEHPYTEVKRFDWIRGYHVGGRSIVWGRQSYRWSDLDFEANLKDGIAVDWPIRYKDIAPWYDYVEEWIGVSGSNEGLPQLPDGKFQPPMEMNCVETDLKGKVESKFADRKITMGRTAHLTEPTEQQKKLGRGKCQFRNLCMRGCPYGAYFSSNGASLIAAEQTGNMTLRPNSIVHSIIYDKEKDKATGVKILDAESKQEMEFYAKIIFVNASALNSAWILMNSANERFPTGLGNSSDQLGRNVMDHHFQVGASGNAEGFEDRYYSGRRANGIYIPRYRNVDAKSRQKDFIRGYGYQGGASREGWSRLIAEMNFGKGMKEQLHEPGRWTMGINGFGEFLPYEDNRITLNKDVLDMYGMPTLTMDVEIKENELNMRKDMQASAIEMLEAAGIKDVKGYDRNYGPGLGIHEMGTARMGRDPKTSVLNSWNQMHDVKNVFITDGACMTSAACVNPSLTYMALTARAADYAVSELKKGNL